MEFEKVGTSGADFAVVVVNGSALTYDRKAENASTSIVYLAGH